MVDQLIRTIVALPADLIRAADQIVRDGQARSRNDLLVIALRRELAARERAAIDAEFADMANDGDYQAEAGAIADQFASADWEALRHADRAR